MSAALNRCRALACVAVVVTSGCHRQPPADDFFPLASKHRWTWRVTTQLGDAAPTEETLHIVGERGEPLLPPGAGSSGGVDGYRRSDDGLEYWLHADASGVQRRASRTLADGQHRADTPPRDVLKAPYVVGTTWAAPTTGYLLERRFDTPREVRHTYAPTPMAYRIDAVGEALQTAAGRLENCLRVRGTATIRVYADPVAGWREMPLSTLEWYCRGVGLARLERSEPASSPFMTGGMQRWELMAFE